jgi:integrase
VYGLLTRLAAFSGMRKSELLALRVMSLNQLHRIVEVKESLSGGKPSSPKTAAGYRKVPVPAALWDELVSYLGDRINEPTSRVFADPNGNATFVWRRFYTAYQAAVARCSR